MAFCGIDKDTLRNPTPIGWVILLLACMALMTYGMMLRDSKSVLDKTQGQIYSTVSTSIMSALIGSWFSK